MKKPILCIDWDGVIHSYKSGWKGAAIIPDPPVPGALEFIVRALKDFDVAIFSSRSHQWGGRRAMKRYLYVHLMALGGCDPQHGQFEFEIPDWWANYIAEQNTMEPWWHETHSAAKLVVKSIKWPVHKPSAMVSIDDRAHQFTGEWPSLESLKSFKPWNKQPALPTPSPQGERG